MIRKYNDDFINQFDEQLYIKYLNTINYLDNLRRNYNNRYEHSYGFFDGHMNTFKESLDHYVLKRMVIDDNFINTTLCNNYFSYLRKLSNDNMYDYYTNVVLYNVLNDVKFSNYKKKYIGAQEDKFREKIKNNNLRINAINKKIQNNKNVSQDEIDLICGVVSDYRENTAMLEHVVKYILNNLTQNDSVLRCSPQVLSAILTYIPYTCSEIKKNGFDPTDVRMCVCNKYNGLDYNGVAVSHGKLKQIILNGKKFSNINFQSMKASESTYPANVSENDDFTLLMIVAFHEITHQYQSYMARTKPGKIFYNSDFFKDGYPMATKIILNQELHDYKENHDNDDIEIHATQVGWEMCANFYRKILLSNSWKNELCSRCIRNRNGTQARYSFAVKKDNKGCLVDAVKYNNDNLFRIMCDSNKREQYFREIPYLKCVFSDAGYFKLDILFIKNFGSTQMGAGLFAKLINTSGIDSRIRAFIQKKGNKQEDKDIAAENIYSGINFSRRKLYMLEYYTRNAFQDGFKINRSLLLVADDIIKEQVDVIRNGKRILNEVLNTDSYDDLISSSRRMALNYYHQIVDNINKNNNVSIDTRKK